MKVSKVCCVRQALKHSMMGMPKSYWQKKFNMGYDIVTRAVFYGSRMLSAQLGTEFTPPNYDGIKKVLSIWICVSTPKRIHNSITEVSLNHKNIVGNVGDIGRYDLLGVIIVGLADELAEETEKLKLHRLLGTLFASKLSVVEKKNILTNEFGIPLTGEVERSVNIMCNLSEVIEEKGIEKGIEKGVKKGQISTLYDLVQDGTFKLEDAAAKAHLTENEFMKKLEEYGLVK